MWDVALAPAVRTMRGATFQPCAWISRNKGSYLWFLQSIASRGKRSLQNSDCGGGSSRRLVLIWYASDT
jgi:hypothetical protein